MHHVTQKLRCVYTLYSKWKVIHKISYLFPRAVGSYTQFIKKLHYWCEIWSFHVSGDSGPSLTGCDAV